VPADEPQAWPVRASRDLWRGAAPFAVRLDALEVVGNGSEARAGTDLGTFDRLVVEHPGAVVVLALDADDRALVLQQYRHPLGMRLVELPAGLLDQPDEDPEQAARRELLEEGALQADAWRHLVTMHTSPGTCSERIEIYLAEDLHHVPDRGGFEPEHEEADMTTSWVPLADLVDGVLEGRLTDGPLQVAVLALVTARAGTTTGTTTGAGATTAGGRDGG
jgi:ADP-ribose pyrophosphatase